MNSSNTDVLTWEIVVTGKVQGVYFRASTLDKARQLGLNGWVRNQRDGTVLIKVQGKKKTLSSLLEWANNGPDSAIVDYVKCEEVEEDKRYANFEIRR